MERLCSWGRSLCDPSHFLQFALQFLHYIGVCSYWSLWIFSRASIYTLLGAWIQGESNSAFPVMDLFVIVFVTWFQLIRHADCVATFGSLIMLMVIRIEMYAATSSGVISFHIPPLHFLPNAFVNSIHFMSHNFPISANIFISVSPSEKFTGPGSGPVMRFTSLHDIYPQHLLGCTCLGTGVVVVATEGRQSSGNFWEYSWFLAVPLHSAALLPFLSLFVWPATDSKHYCQSLIPMTVAFLLLS